MKKSKLPEDFYINVLDIIDQYDYKEHSRNITIKYIADELGISYYYVKKGVQNNTVLKMFLEAAIESIKIHRYEKKDLQRKKGIATLNRLKQLGEVYNEESKYKVHFNNGFFNETIDRENHQKIVEYFKKGWCRGYIRTKVIKENEAKLYQIFNEYCKTSRKQYQKYIKNYETLT